MQNKPKRGGAGLGQGRKQKYGEPTITIGFRVPVSKVPEVRRTVNEILESFKKVKL